MTFNTRNEIDIPIGPIKLKGILNIPEGATGIVLFAHGSGSGRHSPRNQFVARVLHEADLGTLLMDLLTPSEEEIDNQTRQLRFDIRLLASRLMGVTNWVTHDSKTKGLNIGYFGASTGAAAALVAAAEHPEGVGAVVSRGGRPDLAGPLLTKVQAPSLFIVGGDDPVVLDLNKEAMELVFCEKKLEIIPGATHLFEEPNALEEVARLATLWFTRHL